MTTGVDRTDTGGLPIAVRRRCGIPKVRKLWQLWGFAKEQLWAVHNNNLQNLLRGLVERVFMVPTPSGLQLPPRPSPGDFRAIMEGARQALRPWLPRAAPVDYDTFVGYYRGRRATIYRKAADSLLSRSLDRADATVKTFVKAEKVNLTAKPDPAPRVIQPRDPRYNVEVGRYLRPLEKQVYRAIRKVWGGHTVLKGMNAQQQAKELREMWDTFSDPVAVGLDASRFDQHVSVDALKWEHLIYLMCFNASDRKHLSWLLEMQLENRGVAYLPEAVVKYTVQGARMSGDMNTSLGNCLLMSMMVWTWCQKQEVRARLANNGDDCVVFMERHQLKQFGEGLAPFFRQLGFTMVIEEPVDVFERVVFCQTQPVNAGGWVMVRDPRISIAKDAVSLLPLNQCWKKWRNAVGLCGLSLTGGVPVQQEFYHSLSQCEGEQLKTQEDDLAIGYGMKMLAYGMDRKLVPVSPAARFSYWTAFGILPDEQVAMEGWLRDNSIPTPIDVTPTKGASFWI